MKRFQIKRAFSLLLALCLLLTAAPLAGSLPVAQAKSYQTRDIITFGSYPQTKETNSSIIKDLNEQEQDWNYYPYYVSGSQKNFMKYCDISLGNERYRGVYFTQYRPYWNRNPSSYNEQKSNGYEPYNTYWFKYEPLKWTVLDDNGLLICNNIIDSSYFDISNRATWKNSSAEQWLNSTFYETAFSPEERESIKSSNIVTNSVTTTDKVFLLSYEETVNSAYGFNSDYKALDPMRAKSGTDYALCQGLWQNNKYGEWWTRSSKNSNSVRVVNWDGSVVIGGNVTEATVTSCGYVPAIRINTNYAETYGWCLANESLSFDYDKNYRIPMSKYFQVFGINAASLLTSGVNQIPKWNGNCFGLILTSLAQYHNIIDFAPYFSNNGTYLYDYGYDTIGESNGNDYFKLNQGSAAIDVIEKALISQDSVEFSKFERFKNDPDYSDLISFLSGDNARPIMASFQCGLKGHTLLLTNDYKPYELDNSPGWYCIPTYDSNAPASSSHLKNPIKKYTIGPSYLLINPSTTEWQYHANGKYQFGNTYYSVDSFSVYGNLRGQTIFFHDISEMSSSYFTSTLSLWHKRINLQLFGSNIEVKDDKNKVLIEIENGQVTNIDDNCEFKYHYDSVDNNDGSVISFWTDDYTKFKIHSDNAEVLALSDNYGFVSHPNTSFDLLIDMNSGQIKANSLIDNANIDLCAQNFQLNNHCVALESTVSSNRIVSLDIGTNSPIITSDYAIKYKTENISAKDVIVNEQLDPNPPVNNYTIGDVDGNGTITAADARLALRAAVGLEDYESGSAEFLAADVDKNGSITAADARLILRAAVGLETLT